MSGISKIHQCLLQHIMKDGFVEKPDLEELISSLKRTYTDVTTTDRSIDEYIHTINEVKKKIID